MPVSVPARSYPAERDCELGNLKTPSGRGCGPFNMRQTGREAYCGREWARAWVAEPRDVFVLSYTDDGMCLFCHTQTTSSTHIGWSGR